MAKEAWEVVVAYKLVWLRVLFFLLAPVVASFLVITNTVDMDTKWAQMGTFARWGFWAGLIYPGVQSLMAFIDQSLPHAKKELTDKRQETQFIRKDTGP